MVDSTKYYFDNKTYLSFWTDMDVKKNKYANTILTFNDEDIKVIGKNSKVKYEVKPSENNGQGREFYIDKIVHEPLEIEVSKVTIDYGFIDGTEMTLNIPKQGESIEVNKVINIDEIHEKLYVKSINRTKEDIEVHIDPIKYKRDDSLIQIVCPSESGGCTGSDGKSDIISIKSNEDIPASERISGKYKFKIGHVVLSKTGPWKFETK